MAKNYTQPTLKKFSAVKQRRLDLLLEKNSEGTMSSKERILLEALVREAEQLISSNAKRLVEFARNNENAVPANAVPVTVWVTPSPNLK